MSNFNHGISWHILARNREFARIHQELKGERNRSYRLNAIDNYQTVLDILLSHQELEVDRMELIDLIDLIKLLGAKTYADLCAKTYTESNSNTKISVPMKPIEIIDTNSHVNNSLDQKSLSVHTSKRDTENKETEITELDVLKIMQENINNICVPNELKLRKKHLIQSGVCEEAIRRCKHLETDTIAYEENYTTEIVCCVGRDGFYNVNTVYFDIMIGKGQSGTIYASHNLYDDERSNEHDISDVVKIIKTVGKTLSSIENEINIHHDVGIAHSSAIVDDHYYIFMKYGGIPLSSLPKNIPLSLKKKIGLELLREFHKIHFNHIFHRDVKPDNVLVLIYTDSNNIISVKVTICDYGNSCYMRDTNYDFVGSPAYQPHEFHSLNRAPYSIQTEGYGIGILLANIFSEGDFDKYQSTKDRHDDYLPSDIKKAFPDLFLDDDSFNKLKIRDICLYTFIKFIHFLCNENVNQRPIFKNYEIIIKKLESFVLTNNITNNTNNTTTCSDSTSTFKDALTSKESSDKKEKLKYSINGFLSAISGSHDNKHDGVYPGTIMSPRVSPCQSPRKSITSISSGSPKKSPANSPKKGVSNPSFSPRHEKKTILTTRRVCSASSVDPSMYDDKKK